MRVLHVVTLVVGQATMVFPAHADDGARPWSSPSDDSLQIHAFVSQGYLKSSDNNYLADSERGSFEFWEAGINVTKSLTDRMRTGIQLFSRDLGPLGDYTAKIDWAYLGYDWRDWLGARVGRIKLPFGLYNDTSDIDAAHPTALLPQSVYPIQNRDFLLAQTGIELYGYRHLGAFGSLEYRGYAGTIFLDVPTSAPGVPISIARLTIPYVVGGRVMWESPVEGLQLGFSLQRLRLETDLLDLRAPAMPRRVTAEVPATLGVASLEYTRHDLLIAAEYARWYSRTESSDAMVIPVSSRRDERAYVLAAYRVSPLLQPGAYYSIYYPDYTRTRTGPSVRQHDAAATLRFDINSYWILKLEGHYLRGTAALSTAINPGFTLDRLHNHWLLFVAKTTVYF